MRHHVSQLGVKQLSKFGKVATRAFESEGLNLFNWMGYSVFKPILTYLHPNCIQTHALTHKGNTCTRSAEPVFGLSFYIKHSSFSRSVVKNN